MSKEYKIIVQDKPEYELKNFVSIYNDDGGYVGGIKDITDLFKRGIYDIRKAKKDHHSCSIGFNDDEQKWYGWSHRAICGFGIGFIVYEGMSQNGDLEIGFEVKTLDDAKKVAISFAESVS